jgi:hypothetical protein
MKQLKLLLIAATVTSLFVFSQCKKNKPDVFEDYILKRALSFKVVDSTNDQNLIGKNSQRYHPDSIKIFTNQVDTKGIVRIDSLNNYYGIILYFYQLVSKADDINIFSIDAPVYVYLNYQDMDTIQVKKPPFKDFTFYLNNTLVSTAPALSNTIPSITIKK